MRKVVVIIVATAIVVAYASCLPAQNLKLNYSSYLGGSGWDSANAITVDSAGYICIAGSTGSFFDFPIVNAYQSSYIGAGDVFITIGLFP